MSTNSRIAIQKKNGKIKSIYCHFDGYPNNVGSKLLNNYNTSKGIKELIKLGSLVSLGETISMTETFNKTNKDDIVINTYNNQYDYWVSDGRREYNYLYKSDEKRWYCNCELLVNLIN